MILFRRTRVARPASWRWNLAKTHLHTLYFWAVFFVVIPWLIVTVEPSTIFVHFRWNSEPLRILAVALFVLFGILGLGTGTIMAIAGQGTPLPIDTARRLVVIGPYRYVRNPMAIAGIVQGMAVGLFLGSPGVVLYAAVGAPIWSIFVKPAEEADLLARFGEAYAHYRRSVRCWIPRWPGYEAPEAFKTSETTSSLTPSTSST